VSAADEVEQAAVLQGGDGSVTPLVGTEMVDAARDLAASAHHGQRDKFGRPYFDGHVRHVASLVEQWQGSAEAVAAAFLHDVLEKTTLTSHDLAAAGMPERVRHLVDLLTHDEGQSRVEYIAAIIGDPVATLVKRADHLANTDPALLASLPARLAAALRDRYEHEERRLFGHDDNGQRRDA
jgi:(p)ppGpp synthase/HD superfamily hydrolase